MDHTTTQRTAIPDGLRNFDSLPDCAVVRIPVVNGLFGCSSATTWRRVAAGIIPAPQKINPRCTVWKVGDLRRALQGL